MLTLIIGRTASGKDTLASLCNSVNLQSVLSRTTRPKRGEDDTSHIFVDQETADREKENAIAYTKIGDHEYYALEEDLIGKHIYVIDPRGAIDLITSMPELAFEIIYTITPHEQRHQRFIDRAKKADPNLTDEEAEALWMERDTSENEMFFDFETDFIPTPDEFEAKVYSPEFKNVLTITVVRNLNDANSFEIMSERAMNSLKIHSMNRNIYGTLDHAIQEGVVSITPSEKMPEDAKSAYITVFLKEEDGIHDYHLPADIAVSLIATDTQLLGWYVSSLAERLPGRVHLHVAEADREVDHDAGEIKVLDSED